MHTKTIDLNKDFDGGFRLLKAYDAVSFLGSDSFGSIVSRHSYPIGAEIVERSTTIYQSEIYEVTSVAQYVRGKDGLLADSEATLTVIGFDQKLVDQYIEHSFDRFRKSLSNFALRDAS